MYNKTAESEKLRLLVQISVDGYVGGPNGDLDWRTWNYDDKLKSFANNLRDGCDTILLGVWNCSFNFQLNHEN